MKQKKYLWCNSQFNDGDKFQFQAEPKGENKYNPTGIAIGTFNHNSYNGWKLNPKYKMKYWRHCEEDAKISGTVYDKRVKYSPEQIENVKRLYDFEKWSMRKISRETGISRRYIDFILHPEHLVDNRRTRDWTKYHNREQLTKLTRELRQRKKLLISQGKIIPVKKGKE